MNTPLSSGLITTGLTFTQVEIGLKIDAVTNNPKRNPNETARALISQVAKVCKYNQLNDDEIVQIMREALQKPVSEKESFDASASLAVLSFDLAYLNGFDLKGYQLNIAQNFEEFVKHNFSKKMAS